MHFHEKLKKYREEILQLSQKEVAFRLKLSQSALSKYENGRAQITADMLKDFKAAYEIPSDLFTEMLFESSDLYSSTTPEVLREKLKEAELQRVEKMVEEYPEIKKMITNLSYLPKAESRKKVKVLFRIFEAIKDLK
ncbi:helix-turn-helix transcriptional regulator [Bacillus smithii]|uniref:helix-turn-helix domain-containing protein n=1 Tax=Bacillus smithii TaxID=1479 RepID=UPI002E1AAFAE|nr:helix-turn-helix transcriptional regulator [Bacillus smithii]MED1419154.1 helix-turn-helix transcriptional regulator [Bacillus smithii]MED1454864.1 helix-turn-helix transcriptional regulator [Bacillus smithii]